jgi:flagellar biosynthesis protein FlhG
MLLAQQGKRVVLADLDVGGADAHILFGMLNPPRTLTDFVERRVERLDAVLQQVSAHPFLQLIPGTGDTLATRIPQKRGHKKTFVPAGEQEVTCQ